MSSFFDQVQSEIGTAVARGRHLRWHQRLRRTSRAQALVVLAALVVAAPAVGAVTHWFGFGEPLYVRSSGSPTLGSGRALKNTSQLVSLRVADPQGGPPWGLRMVRTTRGDECLQFGRVEDNQLGSLGIDDAWNNDNKFHPFPKTFDGGWGQDCGTTDGAGDAFFNVEWGGIASSANPSLSVSGPESQGCTTPQYEPSMILRHEKASDRSQSASVPGTCPPGASRVVFMGLLGPDTTSITYQAANGSSQVEKTGPDGAYLLVFPLTQKTCNLYSQRPGGGARGPCGEGVLSGSSTGPNPIGAIRAIHYSNGRTCSLTPSRSLVASYLAYLDRLVPGRLTHTTISPAMQAESARAQASFARSRSLSVAQLDGKLIGTCPDVGYVAPKEPHLTHADVASKITVGHLELRPLDSGAKISFTAKEPVKSSSSWYEFATTGPARCEADANGPVGYGDIRAGQKLTTQISITANCKGTIHGVVGYMQSGTPTNEESAGDGGTPGKDGSLIVGHFTITVH